MKTMMILFSLLFATILGVTISAVTGAELPVCGYDLLPVILTGGIFSASFIPINGVSLGAYAFISVNKPVNGGRAKPVNYNLIIFRMDDVLTFPNRDDKGVVITGDLIMKPGKSAIEIEVTPDSVQVLQDSEGETDNSGYKPTLIANRPGTTDDAFEEFLENNVNVYLGCILRYCGTSINPKLFGSECVPLKMSSKSKSDKEGDFTELTFSTMYMTSRAAIYKGTIPTLDTDSGSGSGA